MKKVPPKRRLSRSEIFAKLSGGDRRSIGLSDEVARDASSDPGLFATLFAAALASDPLLRMRAVDAIEKASRRRPEWLQPYKQTFLRQLARVDQPEVHWHVAQILPHLELNTKERDQAISALFEFLQEKSSIVRTFAMQALADFALQDSRLQSRIIPVLQFLTQNGTPAMRSRGRKLLRSFGIRKAAGE